MGFPDNPMKRKCIVTGQRHECHRGVFQRNMRQRLRPLLFDDEDGEAAEAARLSVVAPAQRSEAARAKARTKRTTEGDPVHSFRTLLADLATITRNTVAPRLPEAEPFVVTTRPTPLQRKAFKLLGVRLPCSQ